MEQSQRGKWLRRFGILFVVFVVWQVASLAYPLIPSPWPPFYWALPIHGQVVDADTNMPLEGVIIAAHWELHDTGWTGSPVRQVAVIETVTDKRGRFAFRWWRPRLRWDLRGLLESHAPGMLFFKSGYDWEVCANQTVRPSYNAFPSSDCDGRIIKLRKFQGSEQQYAGHLRDFDFELKFAFKDRSCWWKKIPRLLIGMHQERLQLDGKGIHLPSGNHNSLEDWEHLSLCGSVRNYLRGYLP